MSFHSRLLQMGLAGAVVLALAAAPVTGARAAGYSVAITQELLARDGSPSLVANFRPDGGLATPSWAVCAPGAASCTPAGVTNQVFTPGAEPAGTTFEASATYGGTTYTARSDPWQGAVAATAPPTLTGTPKVGAIVPPHAGAWSGGWGGELDLAHVEACRTQAGTGCTTISYPHAFRDRLAARIDPRFSGDWLFALDERYARETVFTAADMLWPFAVPPTPVGPTVSRSAPLGPVTGPALQLRDHPLLRRDDRLLVGTATCAHRCRVGIRVIAMGGRAARASLPIRGTRDLTIPAAALRFEHGARIRVQIAGTPLVETFVAPHQVVAARR